VHAINDNAHHIEVCVFRASLPSISIRVSTVALGIKTVHFPAMTACSRTVSDTKTLYKRKTRK